MDFYGVLVNVVKVLLQILVNQAEILFGQGHDHILLRTQHILQPHDLAAQADNLVLMGFAGID
ncbi:hypothetical protein D3C76_1175910 [compost metagenome]